MPHAPGNPILPSLQITHFTPDTAYNREEKYLQSMFKTHPTNQKYVHKIQWQILLIWWENSVCKLGSGRKIYILGPPLHPQKIQKLAYQFIWDGREGIPWSLMVLPKEEVRLGVRNLSIIARLYLSKRLPSSGENRISWLNGYKEGM